MSKTHGDDSGRPSRRVPLTSWHIIHEGFTMAPSDFYALVERALADRQMPQSEITSQAWPEAGLLSGSRIYLRVKKGRIVVDICGAPFGTSYFFSYWVVYERPFLFWLLLWVPLVNLLVAKRLFRPPTYYETDTIRVFHHTIHSVVVETVDVVTQALGRKALTEEQKKPAHWELLGR